jgi:serine/threonine protein kinase
MMFLVTAGPTKSGKRGARTRLGVGDRTPEPPKLVGTVVLDRYFVEAELGSGAMGTVYRARHTKLGREVALKVMHEHLMHEPKLMERFHREAQIAARLAHPNVASVLDIGETTDRKQVMVLELAVGTSLEEMMGEPVPVLRTLQLVEQLLRGLEHAHAMGLVHRDLKPDNVIVEISGEGREVPRIVDFGIATLSQPEETFDRLTGTGMIVGTPLYMAPEQARAEQVDHRADLYALGIIMYEMLSCTSPFVGTAMEVAVAKMDKDPPPIATRVADLDPVIAAFVGKLIARDRAKRFSSAREALDVVELYLQDRSAAAAALGIIDVEQAISIVWLPDPPR